MFLMLETGSAQQKKRERRNESLGKIVYKCKKFALKRIRGIFMSELNDFSLISNDTNNRERSHFSLGKHRHPESQLTLLFMFPEALKSTHEIYMSEDLL